MSWLESWAMLQVIGAFTGGVIAAFILSWFVYNTWKEVNKK